MDLIEKYDHPYWGFAPKNFYAEFLAAVEIGTNLSRYFPGLELDTAAEIKEIEVTRGTSLAALIKSSAGWKEARHEVIVTTGKPFSSGTVSVFSS